jgi:hypothetical protein
MITWTPIGQLPDELKDGREVLLWDADEPEGYRATTATFSSLEGGLGGWRNDEFIKVENPTHFAEITPP